jgi:hypothetical protein
MLLKIKRNLHNPLKEREFMFTSSNGNINIVT